MTQQRAERLRQAMEGLVLALARNDVTSLEEAVQEVQVWAQGEGREEGHVSRATLRHLSLLVEVAQGLLWAHSLSLQAKGRPWKGPRVWGIA